MFLPLGHFQSFGQGLFQNKVSKQAFLNPDSLKCFSSFPLPIENTQLSRMELNTSNQKFEDWELIQDILKQGADVEVLEPQSLKTKVKAVIQSLAGVYGMKVGKTISAVVSI